MSKIKNFNKNKLKFLILVILTKNGNFAAIVKRKGKKMTKTEMIKKIDNRVEVNAKMTVLELAEILTKLETKPVSQVNEITIRSQKVAANFQRYTVAVGMLKDDHDRSEIIERLMSENGIYAGINKADSLKSTKNFVGKIVACYNGLTGAGKPGKVSYEMTRLKQGLDVTENCTFKSYARLTYKASL